VIVTYNSGGQLGDCLDSLAKGCTGIDLVDVVVADNASTDDSVTVATRPRDVPVRVVELGRNAGYAAGINAAVDSLAGRSVDAVLVLNPDITVHPGAVAVLAAALDVPGRGIAVPRLVNPDGSLQPSLRRPPTLGRAVAEAVLGGRLASRLGIGELIMEPAVHGRPGPTSWATGAALLISTRAAADIGPWDESLLLYGEEVDFQLRAGERGWTIWFEPASVMDHVGGTQTVTNPGLFALLAVNRVRVYRRAHGRLAGLAYHAAVTMGELLRAAAGRRPSRAAVVALLRPSRRLTALPG
jgi:GT2 family glycosyltransferase